jgi:hypothetical protein
LPASIVDTLKYHNIPNESIDTNVKQLVDMIRLSEKLLPDLSVAENNQINISSKEWQLLGIDPRVADEITKKVNQFEGGLLAG